MIIFLIIFTIIGIASLFILSDIKIELKYRNTLLEKQNKLLQKVHNIFSSQVTIK
jgi:hypothetical protein